jgi:hypothetical protein
MEKSTEQLTTLSASGCELVAAIPIANTRNDNLATGTSNIVYICRKPE